MADVRAAAEKGSAEAQYKLGLAHRKGEGVKKDAAEALKWMQKAAEQGLADAQHDLGFIYAHGAGVPQNFAEGLKIEKIIHGIAASAASRSWLDVG